MVIRDELEQYIVAALKNPALDIESFTHHVMLYGMEVQKHSQGLFPVMAFIPFYQNCLCRICSRNDSYGKIIYSLCDLIFLLFRDHIERDVVLILSPHQKIPPSEISDEICTKHGIKISDVKKTKNPCQIDVVFEFYRSLATQTALRNLPLTFTATVETNNPYGLVVSSSAQELMIDIVKIKFLDEYELCNQNPQSLYSFYESLPKKFTGI